MPSAGQGDIGRLLARFRCDAQKGGCVDRDLRRRSGRIHVQRASAWLNPPPSVPGDGEGQVPAIRITGLREIEPRVIVEERQCKIVLTGDKVQSLIDTRE